MAAAPLGWKGKLPDLMNLIEQSLSAQVDPTFLTGQTGGSMPLHDVGPWFDGTQWWFWNSSTGNYQTAQQGCPVGTIVMWGGDYTSPPPNWLWCDGSDVSRYQYATLFSVVGETWGTGDGQTSFSLPPGGVFFINASGFFAAVQVPPSLPFEGLEEAGTEGVAASGGLDTAGLLQSSDIPGMEANLRAIVQNFANAEEPSLPGTDIPSPQPQGFGSPAGMQNIPLSDGAGNLLGASQQTFSVMPPFVTCCFIIKYQ
jgi:microcystin-dependent protein